MNKRPRLPRVPTEAEARAISADFALRMADAYRRTSAPDTERLLLRLKAAIALSADCDAAIPAALTDAVDEILRLRDLTLHHREGPTPLNGPH